jgi:hypothetical protein
LVKILLAIVGLWAFTGRKTLDSHPPTIEKKKQFPVLRVKYNYFIKL